MRFSPIVLRELMAATRRRSTYRVRWWATLLAMIMTAGFLIVNGIMDGNAGRGGTCFEVQTFYIFGMALLSGVFLTADCLSEEKREGTIGFLLLTDLSEFDVVLGKFAVMSLTAFYGLLALFPITAFPLLLGGVTGDEFWSVSLVQLNTMFISLAVGILVSSTSRDPQRAMAGTLIALLFLVLGLPMAARLFNHLSIGSQFLEWLSPVTSLRVARSGSMAVSSREFWLAVTVSHLAGWACLALATLQLHLTWREKDGRSFRWTPPRWIAAKTRSARRRQLHRKFLEMNPARWLVSARSSGTWLAWLVVIVWAFATLSIAASQGTPPYMGAPGYIKPFAFILKTIFAFEACRFFMGSRRAGTLELLLSTPLSQQQIIQGQAQAFRQAVQWPCFWLILISMLPIVFSIYAGISEALGEVFMMVIVGIDCIRLIADLAAICWVGMRLSLHMKKPQYAPVLTILIVLIAPSVLCWLDLIADLVLIAWAKNGLARDWRELLLSGSTPQSILRMAPPIIPAPPVIRN